MQQKLVTYVGLGCIGKWMTEISYFYLILHFRALPLRSRDHTDVRKEGQPEWDAYRNF